MKNLFKKILAIGLAASMTLGMAVTSFAEENTEAPKSTENVEVWVNGKDVKANDAKGIKADLNKTAEVLLKDLVATEAAPIVVVEDLEEVTAVNVTDVTKTGTLTYTAKVTPTGVTATIEDETKLTEGTLTYDADKKAWSASTEGLKITGEPTAESKIVIAGEWVAKDTDATAEALTIKEDATVKFGSVVTFKLGTLNGLSESLAKGNKYVISVIDAPVAEEGKEVEANTIEDAFDLTKGKAVKTEVKRATAKFDKKTNAFKVTAGKAAGDVEVWIMEYNSKAKEVVACAHFDVAVKEAPKKFSVQIPAVEELKDEETGEVIKEAIPAIEKKYTAIVGDAIELAVAFPEGVAKPHEDTTYTWSVKVAKGETAYVFNEHIEYTDAELTALEALYETASIRVNAEGETAIVELANAVNATKAGTYTITCTNDQSGKKASFKLTVVNNIVDIQIPDIIVPNAYTDKQSVELALGDAEKGYTISTNVWEMVGKDELKELATTDKIKAYVTSNAKLSGRYNAEGEADPDAEISYYGYTLENNKFKLTEKCKEISAKLDKTGKLTVSSKKGVLPGTQAKLVLVVTHKDKTVDTFEAIITVGVAATKIEAGENVALTGVSLLKGKTLTLDPKVTDEGADVVFLTGDKKVATVDEKGVVTAKKAGTVKITVKSGEVELVYEIKVVDELPAETTTTTAAPAQSE